VPQYPLGFTCKLVYAREHTTAEKETAVVDTTAVKFFNVERLGLAPVIASSAHRIAYALDVWGHAGI
jgi:hypothetical protein